MAKEAVGANAVGSSEQNVGDEAVVAATGRDRAAWFALLDEAGAGGWRHADIARHLVAEHGVDAWWAQGVTVAYEQARGIRRPGQRQNGTFETSVTRTVPIADAAEALTALAAVVRDELGVEPLALNVTAKHPTARFPLEGGEFVLASATARPGGTCSIGLTRGRMPDDSRLVDEKARLRAWLGRVG